MSKFARVGERNGNVKLTAENVRLIRETYIPHKPNTGCTLEDLAKEHGVSRETVRKVVTRMAWAHVE